MPPLRQAVFQPSSACGPNQARANRHTGGCLRSTSSRRHQACRRSLGGRSSCCLRGTRTDDKSAHFGSRGYVARIARQSTATQRPTMSHPILGLPQYDTAVPGLKCPGGAVTKINYDVPSSAATQRFASDSAEQASVVEEEARSHSSRPDRRGRCVRWR